MLADVIHSISDGRARSERLRSLLDACDSSLEREVLEVVHQEGYELPDAAQRTIYDDDEPVAQADFFYDREGRSIVVFVDGPVHHKEHVAEDDRRKRRRLRSMGYRVIPVENPDEVAEVWDTV